MKIISDMSGDYADGVPAHLKLEEYSLESDKEVLFYGYGSVENGSIQESHKSFERKTLLNLWTPCEYMNQGDSHGRHGLSQVNFFDEIYTICPHTIQWHKDHFQGPDYKYIFHPFDGSYSPTDFEKDAEVCYFGGIHGKNHVEMAKSMVQFDYRLISMTHNRLVTHHNVPHRTKLDLVAKTKISLCSNLLPLTDDIIHYIKQYPSWEKNQAFSHLDEYIAPQYKCRAAEAAFCRSLLMVKRDPWNLIEHYFVPDEEFIYFDNEEDLTEKITEVLANYDKYQGMIEKAYQRSLNYTSKPLVDIIRSKQEWKHLNV
tara:strand:- start:777 stop:1718 length:942 start_codon:yes stop_codon:yes gene_type:complete